MNMAYGKGVCTCAIVIEDLTVYKLAGSFWLDNESRLSIFDKCVLVSGESPYGNGRWRGECVAELL